MGDFDFEDTAVEKREGFSFLGMIKDIIKLALFIIIVYSLYLGGTIGYSNFKVKEQISMLSQLASKTIDDRKIKGLMKSYCTDYDEIICVGESFKVKRDFDSATVSIKYKYKINLFWKIPFFVTFEPKITEEVLKFNL